MQLTTHNPQPTTENGVRSDCRGRCTPSQFSLFFFALPKKEPKKSSAAPASSPTILLASQAKELVALRSTQTAFACPLGFEEWVPEVAAEAHAVGLRPIYNSFLRVIYQIRKGIPLWLLKLRLPFSAEYGAAKPRDSGA